MVKVKGATVYPSEVEAALRSIEGVRQAYVTDVPDAGGRPEVAALVVTGEPLDTVRAAVRARLSAFKVPTRWLVTGEAGDGADAGVREGGQSGPPAAALRPRAPRSTNGLTASLRPGGGCGDRGWATRRPQALVDPVGAGDPVGSGAPGDSGDSDGREAESRGHNGLRRTADARASERSPSAPETTEPPGAPTS